MTGYRALSSFMGIPILALAITPSFCRNPVLYSELLYAPSPKILFLRKKHNACKHEGSTHTKNYSQLRKAGNERGVPPQRRVQQLAVQCRLVVPESAICTEHFILLYYLGIYMHIHIYVCMQ